MLKRYYASELAAAVQGRPPRVLVPLCGKTIDMKWLYEQGAEVYGVELSEIGVRAFFDDNKLEFTVEEKDGFKIFKSVVGRLNLICGDLFKVNEDVLGGPVDCAWDRGAFEAINVEDREKYTRLMHSVLSPENGRILLSGFEYDTSEYPGPPSSVPLELAQKHYGEYFKVIHQLCSEDELNHPDRPVDYGKVFGVSWIRLNGYIIKRHT